MADRFRRLDGSWSCTRDGRTEPCGDCDGCRSVEREAGCFCATACMGWAYNPNGCRVERERLAARETGVEGLTTPMPGAPDVSLATDSPVFSPAQLVELRAELDALSYGRRTLPPTEGAPDA